MNQTVARLLARTNARRAAGVVPAQSAPLRPATDCANRSAEPVGTVACPTCRGGKVMLKVFDCSVYGTCTVGRAVAPHAACTTGCAGYRRA